MPTTIEALAALLRDTAQAHHHAYAATDGADPEWARWYGQHLAAPMARLVGAAPDAARLAGDLRAIDVQHRRENPDASWPEYYARWFAATYGPAGSDAPR